MLYLQGNEGRGVVEVVGNGGAFVVSSYRLVIPYVLCACVNVKSLCWRKLRMVKDVRKIKGTACCDRCWMPKVTLGPQQSSRNSVIGHQCCLCFFAGGFSGVSSIEISDAESASSTGPSSMKSFISESSSSSSLTPSSSETSSSRSLG